MPIAHHPKGFPFYHPAGWTVRLAGAGIQLMPPSAWEEQFHLLAAPMEGELRPDHPRLLALVDREVHFLGRGFVLDQAGKPFTRGLATGVQRTWTTGEPAEDPLEAAAWLRSLPGMAVFLLAVGRRQRLEERRPDLEAVVNSVGAIPAASAPRAQPVGAPAPSVPVLAPPSAAIQVSPDTEVLEAGERPRLLAEPGWGFTAVTPAGWQILRGEWGVMLQHHGAVGRILIRPHSEPDSMALQGMMVQGFQIGDLRLMLAGPVRLRHGLVLAALQGHHKGVNVPALAWGGMCTGPNDGGALVVAMGQQSLDGSLVEVAEALAFSVRYDL